MRPPAAPPPGPEVDDVVCVRDHVQVVLDDDDRCAVVYQALQHAQKHLDVKWMKADSGLVENEKGICLVARELACPA